jgi:hypothetical protein
MNKPKPDIEFWRDDSQNVVKMRCECWRYFIRDGVADNNGWWPREKYPHSPYCANRHERT